MAAAQGERPGEGGVARRRSAQWKGAGGPDLRHEDRRPEGGRSKVLDLGGNDGAAPARSRWGRNQKFS